jgi:hypothetical protein
MGRLEHPSDQSDRQIVTSLFLCKPGSRQAEAVKSERRVHSKRSMRRTPNGRRISPTLRTPRGKDEMKSLSQQSRPPKPQVCGR